MLYIMLRYLILVLFDNRWEQNRERDLVVGVRL